MKSKFKLGLTLFILGFLGILTMLTASFGDIPAEALERFSPQAIKLLTLINPTLMLFVAVAGGTALYNKVNLNVPTISSLLKIETPRVTFLEQLKYGMPLGLLAGILVMLISFAFNSMIPQEFKNLESEVEITLLARFGYGGITEELLMRFGLMTFLVWGVSKITKRLNNTVYWIGISLTSIIFALGHFPMIFHVVSEPSATILFYSLIGNSIAGLFFGWLYWKKGLESAMIAHLFAHVAMVSIGML